MLSIEKQLLYLLSRTPSMDAQELIRIYEKRNYSAPYIRNGLSRLKKEGYAVTPSRSSYQITDAGRSMIRSINQKPRMYEYQWDHSWQLVMLEIPEAERKKRDQFRADITQVGFGLLYNSVYISPWNYVSEVRQLIEKHQLDERVTLFQGTITHHPITPEQARTIWQLPQVETKYMEQWQWFTGQFQPQMKKALHSHAEPLELFTLYLHLGEIMSELYLIDPMLPEELLPSGWEGKRMLQTFQRHLDALVQAIPSDCMYAAFLDKK